MKPFLKGVLVLGVVLVLLALAFWLLEGMGRGGLPLALFKEKVGVVEIKGVIEEPEEALKWIKAFGDDDKVKAVILRIDSPGGAVGATQEIYQEVLKLKEKKAVVASLGNVAASGGYYIAVAAHKVVANPGTITGSIGVVMYFADFEGLMKKVGIRGHTIKSGPFKDTGSPFRGMTPEEKRVLEEVVRDVHQQFIEAVASSRGLAVEKVRELADGRIFSGRQALELGLVDRLGDFQDALELAKELGRIKGEPEVIYGRRRPGLLRSLLEDLSPQSLRGMIGRPVGAFFLWEP